MDIGLGGATPRPAYFQPVQTPFLANGNYTISAVGLAGCAAGNILAGGQTCAAGGGVNIGLAGRAFLPTIKLSLSTSSLLICREL